jgi:hypothetical protein
MTQNPDSRRIGGTIGRIMRTAIFLFVLLSYPACAQVSSGTIIVFNFTKDQLAVAADSRGININGDTRLPNDYECKIAVFDHRLVFTSVGNARRAGSPIDTVPSWDNWGVAKVAFRGVKGISLAQGRLQLTAKSWADTIAANWKPFYHWHPEEFGRLLSKTGGVTMGFFEEGSEEAIYFKAARIKFDAASPDPIGYEIGDLTDCWPCGQQQGRQICAVGVHLDVAAQFCSQRKHGDRIDVHTKLQGASESTRLPVKIVEMTIDAYEKTAGDVGGNVDAITLFRGGTPIWNSRKANCPENQD